MVDPLAPTAVPATFTAPPAPRTLPPLPERGAPPRPALPFAAVPWDSSLPELQAPTTAPNRGTNRNCSRRFIDRLADARCELVTELARVQVLFQDTHRASRNDDAVMT